MSVEGPVASSHGIGKAPLESGDPDAFPVEEEAKLIMEIYKTGLKHCSPKVLLTLMPPDAEHNLNTERIKSHLQKYRNNANKSIENFSAYYESELKAKFKDFSENESWKNDPELDLEKISTTALHVNDANSGRNVSYLGAQHSQRELRSSTNASSSKGELRTLLEKHKLLFSEFTDIANEFVELGNDLKRSLNQLELSQEGRASSSKKRRHL